MPLQVESAENRNVAVRFEGIDNTAVTSAMDSLDKLKTVVNHPRQKR